METKGSIHHGDGICVNNGGTAIKGVVVTWMGGGKESETGLIMPSNNVDYLYPKYTNKLINNKLHRQAFIVQSVRLITQALGCPILILISMRRRGQGVQERCPIHVLQQLLRRKALTFQIYGDELIYVIMHV